MKIVNLFNDDNVTLNEYLEKIGVKNAEEYLKFNTVEDDSHYNNLENCVKITKKHKDKIIRILQDSDYDGAMSASMLNSFLHEKGFETDVIIHDKFPKAHGLTDSEVMNYLTSIEPSLLIIPDAGTSDVKQCKILSELGWEIIILDHHEKVEANGDNKYAIVINNQMDDNVENKHGSGTLVTWHFLHAWDSRLAKKYTTYVAVSLLSDSMNLCSDENGTFIHWGFKENAIHNNLKPIIDKFQKDYLPMSFSFGGIIPKGNATIRMGSLEDKKYLIDTLSGFGEYCDEKECIKRMTKCYNLQTKEANRLMEESVEIDDLDENILLCKLSEKSPCTGLVANKLMSKYSKPILLLHEDEDSNLCAGSVRSPMEIKDLLEQCENIEYAQGHSQALGTAYKKENEQAVKDYLYSLTLPEPHIEVLTSYSKNLPPTDLIDEFGVYTDLWASNSNVVTQPRYAFTDIKLSENKVEVIGRGGTTIKFRIGAWTFVKFFCSHKWIEDNIKGNMLVDIIGTLQWNEWQGNKTPQVIIDEIIFKEQKDEFEALFG